MCPAKLEARPGAAKALQRLLAPPGHSLMQLGNLRVPDGHLLELREHLLWLYSWVLSTCFMAMYNSMYYT